MLTITQADRAALSSPVQGIPAAATPLAETNETPVPSETLEAPKPQEALSPRFAQLARKEKALRAQQQQIQKEKEELKAKLAEYETSYIPKSKLSEMARTNPLAYLEQSGITPDEFTQALLNANPQDAAIQKILQRIEAVENGQKQTLTTMEQQQKQAYDQALTQIRNDIQLKVQADSRFETIREADAQGWEATEGAVSLIETIFQEGWAEKKIPKGTVIQNEQALEFVQEWVKEKAYQMAQMKGVKERFAPAVSPEVKALPATKSLAEAASERRAPAARTLTNSMNATKTTRLSEKERRARAIAALTGELQ